MDAKEQQIRAHGKSAHNSDARSQVARLMRSIRRGSVFCSTQVEAVMDGARAHVYGASLIALLLSGCVVDAREQVQQHAAHSLGTVDFPITCSTAAQGEFNRAIALLHHMTYPQARQAFERVATIDGSCAMAHWGIAMTLFQPLWPTRPRPDALRRGWDAVQNAKRLQPRTDRE